MSPIRPFSQLRHAATDWASRAWPWTGRVERTVQGQELLLPELRRPDAPVDATPLKIHPHWASRRAPSSSPWTFALEQKRTLGETMAKWMEEWPIVDVSGWANLEEVAQALGSHLVVAGAGALKVSSTSSALTSIPLPAYRMLPLLAELSANLVFDSVSNEELMNRPSGAEVSDAEMLQLIYEALRVSAHTICGRNSPLVDKMAVLTRLEANFPFKVQARDRDFVILQRIAFNDGYLPGLERDLGLPELQHRSSPPSPVEPPAASAPVAEPTPPPRAPELDEFLSEAEFPEAFRQPDPRHPRKP